MHHFKSNIHHFECKSHHFDAELQVRNYRFFVLFVMAANVVAACVLGGSLAVAVSVAQANGGRIAMAVRPFKSRCTKIRRALGLSLG